MTTLDEIKDIIEKEVSNKQKAKKLLEALEPNVLTQENFDAELVSLAKQRPNKAMLVKVLAYPVKDSLRIVDASVYEASRVLLDAKEANRLAFILLQLEKAGFDLKLLEDNAANIPDSVFEQLVKRS